MIPARCLAPHHTKIKEGDMTAAEIMSIVLGALSTALLVVTLVLLQRVYKVVKREPPPK